MQTELFLIRHGETTWNAESRFQGHQDSPLTAIGVAQAQAAANYLRAYAITALYSSDLPRTLQTAQPIATATGLTIIEEPALRERNLGIFEGRTRAEVEVSNAQDFANYLSRQPEFEIPSGESLKQLEQRIVEIMTTLARRHPGESIAVVSHGAILTTFLRRLQGIPLSVINNYTVPNGSVSHVRFHSDPAAWTIINQGETFQP